MMRGRLDNGWWHAARACALASMLALAGAAGISEPARAQSVASLTSNFDLKRCAHRLGHGPEAYGTWRCKGLDGMPILVSAGDQRTTMSFGPDAGKELAIEQTLPAFNDIDSAPIEWRVERDAKGSARPFAAIVRWHTSVLDDDAPVQGGRPKTIEGRVLVVISLARGNVCHVGYVDARANPDADALARRIADERARAFHCGTDQPVILGKTGPGFSAPNEAERIETN